MSADRNGVTKEKFQAKLAQYMYSQNYSPYRKLEEIPCIWQMQLVAGVNEVVNEPEEVSEWIIIKGILCLESKLRLSIVTQRIWVDT